MKNVLLIISLVVSLVVIGAFLRRGSPQIEVTSPVSNEWVAVPLSIPVPAELTKKVETKQSDIKKFEEKLRAIESSFPTIASMRNRSDAEVHHRPPGLTDSAVELGQVVDEVKRDPRLAPAALRFYFRCASDSALLTSLRAVCLRTWMDSSRRYPKARNHQDNPHILPQNVKELAISLPSD